MAGSGVPQRRLRADAQRNRERLLEAADAAFAEQGVGASLEGVARAAGVAAGTLYGHFPDRQALLAALLRARHTALFELAGELAQEEPQSALQRWVGALAEHTAAYRGLAAVLYGQRGTAEASELGAACARMQECTASLVERARAGGLPGAVGADDVVALADAAAWLRAEGAAGPAVRLIGFTTAGWWADDRQ